MTIETQNVVTQALDRVHEVERVSCVAMNIIRSEDFPDHLFDIACALAESIKELAILYASTDAMVEVPEKPEEYISPKTLTMELFGSNLSQKVLRYGSSIDNSLYDFDELIKRTNTHGDRELLKNVRTQLQHIYDAARGPENKLS